MTAWPKRVWFALPFFLLASTSDAEDFSQDAVAGTGCVALIDAIYASNIELGKTAGGEHDAVRQEWMDVLAALAPELSPEDFDAIYADIYPNMYPIVLDFGREVIAGTESADAPSESAEAFRQMVDLCQRKKQQSLGMGSD